MSLVIDNTATTRETGSGTVAKKQHHPAITVRGLNFFYGAKQVLFDNTLEITPRAVTAIIGPSGCGKSTHIRVYNKMYLLYRGQTVSGEVIIGGRNILSSHVDAINLRRKVGMILQKPTPFPMSIFDNVAYGLKLHYRMPKSELTDRVEHALRFAALWDEVQGELAAPGVSLSLGQQQRLCIARAIAIEPDILLMDEPTSALDPIATGKIEELIEALRERYTIVLVTHNLQQAARISDFTAFLFKGRIVEFGTTRALFINPVEHMTEDYISGRFN